MATSKTFNMRFGFNSSSMLALNEGLSIEYNKLIRAMLQVGMIAVAEHDYSGQITEWLTNDSSPGATPLTIQASDGARLVGYKLFQHPHLGVYIRLNFGYGLNTSGSGGQVYSYYTFNAMNSLSINQELESIEALAVGSGSSSRPETNRPYISPTNDRSVRMYLSENDFWVVSEPNFGTKTSASERINNTWGSPLNLWLTRGSKGSIVIYAGQYQYYVYSNFYGASMSGTYWQTGRGANPVRFDDMGSHFTLCQRYPISVMGEQQTTTDKSGARYSRASFISHDGVNNELNAFTISRAFGGWGNQINVNLMGNGVEAYMACPQFSTFAYNADSSVPLDQALTLCLPWVESDG